jgi:hypothetical protein
MPYGLIGIGIAGMFQTQGDTPKPTAAQLTALRRSQSDLHPLLAIIGMIPIQTDDPALVQAAERAHEALSALVAEMAVVIHRAKRRPGGEAATSVPSRPTESRQASTRGIIST